MQTAVKGKTADSEDAVVLPTEHDAAREFREEHRATDTDFWCGTVNGCGRKLIIRIGDDKIPHFYHQGESDVPCRLAQKNRGRLDIEVPVALADLRHWRDNRGFPQGEVAFFDPLDHHDARYMHISGPTGIRDTRVVLGNVTIIQVQQDARSPQGREWDWFVHHRNTELRGILDEQGISYARIKFTPTKDSAVMQVFLTTQDNVGDWGRVGRYEPAPHRAPRPPAPTRSVMATKQSAPARMSRPNRPPKPPTPSQTWMPAFTPSAPRRPAVPPKASSNDVRHAVKPYALEDLRAQIARMRGVDGGPTHEPTATRKTSRRRAPKPPRQNAPTVKVPAPRLEEQLPDELRDAIAQLEEALILGDRRGKTRCAQILRALHKTHQGSLSRDDDRAIKALLSQAGMRG